MAKCCVLVSINTFITVKHRELSMEIWKNFHKTNWDLVDFCKIKGYVCSLLSKMVYNHMPQYELSQTSRIKIIPSDTYLLNYINKRTFDLSSVLSDMDFGENFIIENEDLIIIGVKLRNIIFISVRGTQSFIDGIVDVKFLRMSGIGDSKIKLHRGFYKAVLKEIDNVVLQLSRFSNSNVYITGHSLGGAMAAILYNILALNKSSFLSAQSLFLKSCYTYGMPRYANNYATTLLQPTFQIYNPNDVVPVLPPKCFGYNNSREEYKLLVQKVENITNDGKLSLLRTIKLFNGKDIGEHKIEYYVDKLSKIT